MADATDGDGKGRGDDTASAPSGMAYGYLQFRIPTHELKAFHELAYAASGMKHGAKVGLFRRMWAAYEAQLAAKGTPVDEAHTREAIEARTEELTGRR